MYSYLNKFAIYRPKYITTENSSFLLYGLSSNGLGPSSSPDLSSLCKFVVFVSRLESVVLGPSILWEFQLVSYCIVDMCRGWGGGGG